MSEARHLSYLTSKVLTANTTAAPYHQLSRSKVIRIVEKIGAPNFFACNGTGCSRLS